MIWIRYILTTMTYGTSFQLYTVQPIRVMKIKPLIKIIESEAQIII